MHILLIYMYYLRPGDPGIKRQNEFCQLWSAQPGVRVSVLTSQLHYNNGQIYDDLRGKDHVIEKDGLVEVHRVAGPDTYYKGFKGRAISQAGWSWNLRQVFKQIEPPDVVVGVTPPLFTALAVVSAKRRWRIPAILEVCDIWPEMIVKMGIAGARHPGVVVLSWLERWAYRNCDHLVATASTQKANIVRRGLKRSDDVSVILHGALREPHDAVPAAQRRLMREQLGVSADQTLVMYAGSHGPAYRISALIDVAEMLRERSDIVFITLGAGTELTKLKQAANDRRLANLRFLGPRPVDEMPAYLKAADIGVSFAYPEALPGWDTETRGVFRSMLFDYFAARLAVVFNDPGDPKRMIHEQVQGGLYADTSENYSQFAQHISYLADHPAERVAMGERNYQQLAVPYDRSQLAMDYLQTMQKLVQA